MIHISTDLDISPETARTMAKAFADMAASDDTIDDADAGEVKGMLAALARAISEAKPISFAASLAFNGEALKTEVLRQKGSEAFVALDNDARKVGCAGRCIRAELALLYVDDDGEETPAPHAAEGGGS